MIDLGLIRMRTVPTHAANDSVPSYSSVTSSTSNVATAGAKELPVLPVPKRGTKSPFSLSQVLTGPFCEKVLELEEAKCKVSSFTTSLPDGRRVVAS